MLNSIEEIIEDFKVGKPVIIVDDESRENEGDLIVGAEVCTYDTLNFMVSKCRGLVCVPVENKMAGGLGFSPMVLRNTDSHNTAFTVSVDGKNTTTGISVGDRLSTIKQILEENQTISDFKTPGHMFPLIAKKGGVLERRGHTEAAVDFAKYSGLKPVGVICEILKDDGTMARLPDLKVFAKTHNLKIGSVDALVEYRKKNPLPDFSNSDIQDNINQTLEETKVKVVQSAVKAKLPTTLGKFDIVGYENSIDDKEHLALIKGDLKGKKDVLLRVHSECFTGDVFHSKRCDCGVQLDNAIKAIEKNGEGLIIYLRQEGRGIGLTNKLKAYVLQEQGFDTVDANLELGFDDDMRDYKIAAEILKDLGINSVRIITNNPLKVEGLKKYGIEVSEIVKSEVHIHKDNFQYMKTKAERMGHKIKL